MARCHICGRESSIFSLNFPFFICDKCKSKEIKNTKETILRVPASTTETLIFNKANKEEVDDEEESDDEEIDESSEEGDILLNPWTLFMRIIFVLLLVLGMIWIAQRIIGQLGSIMP